MLIKYMQRIDMHMEALESADKVKLGPELWSNSRGEAMAACQKLNSSDLMGTTADPKAGVTKLLDVLS